MLQSDIDAKVNIQGGSMAAENANRRDNQVLAGVSADGEELHDLE